MLTNAQKDLINDIENVFLEACFEDSKVDVCAPSAWYKAASGISRAVFTRDVEALKRAEKALEHFQGLPNEDPRKDLYLRTIAYQIAIECSAD